MKTPSQQTGVECSIGHDSFVNAREKGVKSWILKHLFHKENKYLIISWIILIGIVAVMYNQVKVLVGESVDAIAAVEDGSNAVVLRYFWMILLLAIGYPVLNTVANFMREVLAQRMERDVRD